MNRSIRTLPFLTALAGMILVSAGSAHAQRGTCVVAYVVDGDTFNCRDGTTVRLLGADAPEGGRFGDAARRALATLLPVDGAVQLQEEGERHDSKGRLLAYVFLGEGKMANEVLVRLGYAYFRPDPDHPRYAARLRAAEEEARKAKLGVWSR